MDPLLGAVAEAQVAARCPLAEPHVVPLTETQIAAGCPLAESHVVPLTETHVVALAEAHVVALLQLLAALVCRRCRLAEIQFRLAIKRLNQGGSGLTWTRRLLLGSSRPPCSSCSP